MSHGNVHISLIIDATDFILISKDGQWQWLSFEMWTSSVPFIIREIFTFSWGMSARDGNFLYNTQATTKPNIHFIVLDQLRIKIVQKFGVVLCDLRTFCFQCKFSHKYGIFSHLWHGFDYGQPTCACQQKFDHNLGKS